MIYYLIYGEAAMITSSSPQNTDFSRDILGRYVCNGLDEAKNSTIKAAIPNVRGPRPDAREFDVIVIGGGSFGAVVAQHLFFRDKAHRHRILVLEGGPFVLPEHVQNLPMLGLGVAEKIHLATLQAWQQQGRFDLIRQWSKDNVWGLAWHSPEKFPGLAYCLGGRSLFFGGWSPQLLDTELSATYWPNVVVNDLNNRYFRESSEQIGTNVTNDFINPPNESGGGSLHEALRQILLSNINTVTDAIPLSQLPLHLDNVPSGQENLFKLEAPLAVQSSAPRSGFYPFNKFSTAPLLMKAARAAQNEANNDDVKKRLMVVPNCHVKKLIKMGDRVTEVQTNLGNITVPANGLVIIALGTIESTRLALNSFGDSPNANLMGKNLMAHLRSNLDIRIPREALPPGVAQELQASALFVKGRHQYTGGTVGHFHLQITASGLGVMGTDSEAELFKKVPDIDGFAAFQNITDSHVVITIRGIGEMEPQNPNSLVRSDSEVDEFGVPRALVLIQPSAKDSILWDAMDKAADDVAKLFVGTQPLTVLSKRRDELGTTHHEAGTLWMGDNPNTSVTNADGRFHSVVNTYVVGPALFPTIGSPNPMLTGVALARRLGDLLGQPLPYIPEAGFTALFNGFDTKKWQMSTIKNQPDNRSNPGNFIVVDGTLESVPDGNDLGLYWHTEPLPTNFILKLEWLRWGDRDNSGVFIRFPRPDSQGYNNTAYVGVKLGFEVQIDEYAQPDGDPKSKTGAIYSFAAPQARSSILPAGQWQEFEIRVQGQNYSVLLNGVQVTTYTFTGDPTSPERGLPEPRFIGLQAYPGARVAFRKIRFKAL
jgi:choline dehydrogenase-like flavoprotein